MNTKKLLLVVMVAFSLQSNAQRFFTKGGEIFFNATSPASPEKIEAVNKSVVCVVDSKTGAIQFSVLMKGFEFHSALMQEHFNENYVESEKFPSAVFKGQISNNEIVNYNKDGVYTVNVKGKLTIHGVTKDVESNGKLAVKDGKINASAEFNIVLKDYSISIPALVAEQVAKIASIKVACSLELLKN